jgi:hypothetical protein
MRGFEVFIRQGHVVDAERVSGIVRSREPGSSKFVVADNAFAPPIGTPVVMDVTYDVIRSLDMVEHRGRAYVRVECKREIGRFRLGDRKKPSLRLWLPRQFIHPAGHWCSKGSTILVPAWDKETDPEKEKHMKAWREANKPAPR